MPTPKHFENPEFKLFLPLRETYRQKNIETHIPTGSPSIYVVWNQGLTEGIFSDNFDTYAYFKEIITNLSSILKLYAFIAVINRILVNL